MSLDFIHKLTSHDVFSHLKCGDEVSATTFIAWCIVGHYYMYSIGIVCVGSQGLYLTFHTWELYIQTVIYFSIKGSNVQFSYFPWISLYLDNQAFLFLLKTISHFFFIFLKIQTDRIMIINHTINWNGSTFLFYYNDYLFFRKILQPSTY